MEKVNIKFYDNYTVSYQHKKILQFVPELSVDQNLRIVTPNIPLLVSRSPDICLNSNLTLDGFNSIKSRSLFAVFLLLLQMHLQTLSTQSKGLNYLLSKSISLVLTAAKFKPFVEVTADQLVFGYDDTLVSLAHKFYPKNKRPMEKMGLLNGVS
jgi:scavenger receptor class B, member 1